MKTPWLKERLDELEETTPRREKMIQESERIINRRKSERIRKGERGTKEDITRN